MGGQTAQLRSHGKLLCVAINMDGQKQGNISFRAFVGLQLGRQSSEVPLQPASEIQSCDNWIATGLYVNDNDTTNNH